MRTQKIYFAPRTQFNDPYDGKIAIGKLKNNMPELDARKSRMRFDEDLSGYQDKLDKSDLGFFSMCLQLDNHRQISISAIVCPRHILMPI